MLSAPLWATERLEEEKEAGIMRFYPYGIDDAFVEFERNLDHENLYTVKVVYDAKFKVVVRTNPRKETVLEQRLVKVFPHQMALIEIPSASFVEEGDFARPDIVGVFPRQQQSRRLPFLVKVQGESEERILLFDPTSTHSLALISKIDAVNRTKVLSGLRKGTLQEPEVIDLLNDALADVLRHPSEVEIQNAYFEMRREEYDDREVKRVEVALELDALRTEVLQGKASDEQYRRLVKLLNAYYPVDYKYLNRNELKSFAARFAFDLDLIDRMSPATFVAYYKVAGSRIRALVAGLEYHHHGAVSAAKLQSLMYLLPTDDAVLKPAVEMARLKHAQNPAEFSATALLNCEALIAGL